MTLSINNEHRELLTAIARTLVDQDAARIVVPPQRPSSGHWFGGGNMVQDASDTLWLVGRYRNHGDSRTGLGKGERGLELAIFKSDDEGATFKKTVSLSKADLQVGDHEVLSIEGTALRLTNDGVQLFLSTEKAGIVYPPGLDSFLKPGTGVWTVDRIVARNFDSLKDAQVETVLASSDPQFNQVKDPFVFDHGEHSQLLFCTHPFCWSSSNTGHVDLHRDGTLGSDACFDFFPRGFTWDVAMTRGTAILELPPEGALAGTNCGLFFYDGGECVRDLDEHSSAVKRPRGYSCEELGGVAVIDLADLHQIHRLSVTEPLFVSPHGTGCSRYVDVLATKRGYYATWQQAQDDGSQPLVMNFVTHDRIQALLQR